jgi:hypothetical protein
MSVLELTPDESKVIECALRTYEETLLLEIMQADMRALRDALRRREILVHSLLERVREATPEMVATD